VGRQPRSWQPQAQGSNDIAGLRDIEQLCPLGRSMSGFEPETPDPYGYRVHPLNELGAQGWEAVAAWG
jgi:hypothetical protein